MKKIIEQIKERAIIWIIIFMLSTGATFLINAGKSLWDLPETVKDINRNRKTDSIVYMNMWITRIRYQDSVNNIHSLWLQRDLDTINSIKSKLKKNRIK